MQNKKPYILLIPSLLFTGLLLIGSLVNGVLESKSLKYYKEVLKSDEFWDSFLVTLRISTLSTLISLVIGISITLILYFLHLNSDRKNALKIQRIFQIPMVFPYLVSAYMIFLVLTQSGFIARVLFNIGIIDEMGQFPILVNDKSGYGIIFSYVWKTSPFVVLMLYPTILKIENGWLDVKKIFGASSFSFFKEIVFPMTTDILKVTSYIIFSYTFLSFEIPYILGTTYPKALSVYSYQIYASGSFGERPKAFVINTLSLIFIFTLGMIYNMIKSISLKGGDRDRNVK